MPGKPRLGVLPLVLLLAVMVVGAPASADTDPNHPYVPGIPRIDWGAGAQKEGGSAPSNDTIAEAARARQWIRIPWTRFAASLLQYVEPKAPGDPVKRSWQVWKGKAYAMPDGAKRTDNPPKRFGYFPPVHVRSVAFGTIPATFTLHIEQLRDGNDLPEPLTLVGRNGEYVDGGIYTDDSLLTGRVRIRISDLVVDGVPVDLGAHCSTARPVEVEMHGKGFWEHDPALAGEALPGQNMVDYLDQPTAPPSAWAKEGWRNTTTYFDSASGGVLTGSVEVPPFANCGRGADDLSPLVTSVASGPGNRMLSRVSPGATDCYDPSYWEPKEDPTFNPPAVADWFAAVNGACRASVPWPYPTD